MTTCAVVVALTAARLFLIYLDIFFDLLNTLNLLHLRCL